MVGHHIGIDSAVSNPLKKRAKQELDRFPKTKLTNKN